MRLEVSDTEELFYLTLVPGAKPVKVAMLIARAFDVETAIDESLVNAALRQLSRRADVVVYGINVENWRGSEIKRLAG